MDADQYRDSSNLDARTSLHARFGTNSVPWHEWVTSLIGGLAGHERVLEVGCGTGELWHESGTNPAATHTVVLTGLSAGMVRRARERLGTAFCFAVADAAALPVARASMDLVLANRMLYHLPDRVAAIGELRRVLRESGVLCAVTNGPGHVAELDDLVMEAGGGGRQAFWRQGFSLENGQAQLVCCFATVELHLYDDSLAVTDPGRDPGSSRLLHGAHGSNGGSDPCHGRRRDHAIRLVPRQQELRALRRPSLRPLEIRNPVSRTRRSPGIRRRRHDGSCATPRPP